VPIGITEDHHALHEAVRGWAERHASPAVMRAALEAETETDALPPFWSALADQGWLGLHAPEAHGGSGVGLAELVVVLEELGGAAAPGPHVGHALATAILGDAEIVAELVTGERVAAVALSGLDAVPGAHLASLLVASVNGEWRVFVDDEFSATERPSLDPTRRVARVELRADGATLPLDTEQIRDLAAVVYGADAVGGAQWCVDAAAAYATERVQFGRPIGQFQGVKHRCANMLARTELGRAAVWDAARAVGVDDAGPLTAAAAAAIAVDGFVETAKDCVQVHGGTGCTWEHDAHVYLRRATASRQLIGGPRGWHRRAADLALAGMRRRLAVALPPEADEFRGELRDFLAEIQDLGEAEQRRRLADAGYVQPQWPKPWGRDAGAIEQLAIAEEFRAAKIVRPNISIGGWAVPPLMIYGTPEQQERWIPPTLRGEIEWCQLFSEPGAGSDLAALSTRAERVEGGWIVNGQKVWTSLADRAQWGFLVARTDPEAPKHAGISFFMLDMATPGIDIRPLKELTGHPSFNEVFFDDVFIPDDCLVGAEHDGWRATRTSLANERVYMGSGTSLGHGLRGVLELAEGSDDPLVLAEVGELVVTEYALAVLGFRLTLGALDGAEPGGAEASVRKLLGAEHDQRLQEVGLALLDAEGLASDGVAAEWVHRFLFNRALTVAGGTSEVQRNIIGERVLGLPRDAG
jgi:alkylation response protein AidB-like acyl-CoA dehydrogenase